MPTLHLSYSIETCLTAHHCGVFFVADHDKTWCLDTCKFMEVDLGSSGRLRLPSPDQPAALPGYLGSSVLAQRELVPSRDSS